MRSAQDDLQPLHPLEPAWRVQQDLRGASGKGRDAEPVDDRCHSYEGASNGSESADQAGRHLAICYHLAKQRDQAYSIALHLAQRNPDRVEAQIFAIEMSSGHPATDGDIILRMPTFGDAIC